VTAVQDLQEWAAVALSNLEQVARELEGQIAERRIELSSLQQGQANTHSAYRVRQKLLRHGQVDVLCDLITGIDPIWQPIIERILGARRFTLITAESNYAACLQDFLAFSEDETDNLHLARPHDARQHERVRPGSLAEKVQTDSPVARGLLNRHLGWMFPFEHDEDAAQADVASITPRGVRANGGTVERMKPLLPRQLVFGAAVREKKRRELDDELDRLRKQAEELTGVVRRLAELRQTARGAQTSAGRIQPDLEHEEAETRAGLELLQNRLEAILQALDFVALQEAVSEAWQRVEAIQGRLSKLHEALGKQQSEVEQAQSVRATRQAERNGMVFGPEPDGWQGLFDDLAAGSPDYAHLVHVAEDRRGKAESDQMEQTAFAAGTRATLCSGNLSRFRRPNPR